MDALLHGLVWLLVYALGIVLACYIVTRLATQMFTGFAAFACMVWTIGGLILLILAIRLLAPALGGV